VAACCAALWRRAPPPAARLAVAAAAWPWITVPPVFGLRDPDIYRLGLVVGFALPLMLAACALALRLEERPRLLVAAAAVLALLLVPPARATSRAWGPGGSAFTSGNGWKLRDPGWEARLTPERARLFRRQARMYLAP
jgi:hypothetical protein